MALRTAARLKSRKIITALFKGAKSYNCYPMRLVWSRSGVQARVALVQAAFSVPKKQFKRAVDRNLLRRRISEAYRLHESDLYKHLEINQLVPSAEENGYAFMLLYTAKTILPYSDIEKGIIKMIRKFSSSH